MISLVALILIFLCCSAFFSASETALFSLSSVHVHKLKKSKKRSAEMIVAALKRPRDTLVTILLGNELVNISISIAGAAIISRIVKLPVETGTLVAVAAITPIVLIFGEILPKNISLRNASTLSHVIIWPLRFFHGAVTPFRVILTWIADRMVRIFGGGKEPFQAVIMEEEYRRLIDLGRKEGVIVEEERELIHNVFDFSDKVVRDIMTPADKIFMLPIDTPYDRMVAEIKNADFSRVPFYDGDRSNIAGILHVRDLQRLHRGILAGNVLNLKDYLNPPLFVECETPLEHLLKGFQRTQMHMAFISGDDGAVKGIVTMDDVLQELFGEMKDDTPQGDI